MKLNSQQQDQLKKYLYKNLRFEETYIEFFDHILSALENVPDNKPFMEAVDAIVEQDFGGYNGMTSIETQYYRSITKEIRYRYFTYLTGYFKFHFIGITVLLAFAFYWITGLPWFGGLEFFLAPILIQAIPSVLVLITNIKLHRIFTSRKRSVKHGIFKWLRPNMLWVFVIIWELLYRPDSPAEWIKNIRPGFSTIFLLAITLHTLCYYKIYQKEFKTVALH